MIRATRDGARAGRPSIASPPPTRAVSVLAASTLPAVLLLLAVFSWPAWAGHSSVAARDLVPEVEPNDTCPGQLLVCPAVVEAAELTEGDLDWYHFEASAGDRLTIATEPIGARPADTYLEFYSVCGGPVLAEDDDSGPGLGSRLDGVIAPQSGTYRVRCRTLVPGGQGAYRLSIACTPEVPPPANDTCGGAIELERCSEGRLDGSMDGAGNRYDPGPDGCTGYAAAGRDLVYRFTLEPGDRLAIRYGSAEYDAACYVMTDCGQAGPSCVAGVDAGGSGADEELRFESAAGGVYYGTDAGGRWTLAWAASCSPVPHGACCTTVCAVTTEAACRGIWLQEMPSCDPFPCAIPVTSSSWGRIKAAYR